MTECLVLFLFKQKTAYEMRISDWSSDVCSSDLDLAGAVLGEVEAQQPGAAAHDAGQFLGVVELQPERDAEPLAQRRRDQSRPGGRRHQGERRQVDADRPRRRTLDADHEIGRASCGERLCQYV